MSTKMRDWRNEPAYVQAAQRTLAVRILTAFAARDADPEHVIIQSDAPGDVLYNTDADALMWRGFTGWEGKS